VLETTVVAEVCVAPPLRVPTELLAALAAEAAGAGVVTNSTTAAREVLADLAAVPGGMAAQDGGLGLNRLISMGTEAMGGGVGGGIFVQSGNLRLINCTFAKNASLGGAGGIFRQYLNYQYATDPASNGTEGQGIGGAIYNYAGVVNLLNTVVSGSNATSASPDLAGPFTSSGFNLIGNNQGVSGLSILDFQNVAANLGPLQDNGGSTLTCALLQGSPAIGAGTANGAPLIDQRGVPRPPNHVDIGAFQLATLITPAVAWSNPADIVYPRPLGAAQLIATVGVEGTLRYSPPAGTVLSAGANQLLTVVFTPTDLSKYTAATNNVTINVLKANQTITFDPIGNHPIGDPPILLSASTSSGLPVSFSLISGPAKLTGNLLTLGSTSGLVTVRASQAGDANHNPAPSVDQAFVLGTFPLPVISVQPSDQNVNAGDRVTFNVDASNGPLQYQWHFDGKAIQSEVASTLVLARVKATQAGPYDVIVSNPSGSVTSRVAVLTVNIPAGSPVIVSQPQDQNVRVGEATTFSVVAAGAHPFSFQWYQGPSGDTSRLIAGATNASYLALNLTTNTVLWVNVENSYGTADSEAAVVTMFPANAARLKLQMIAGQASLTIDGILGTTYRIEYSTDLGANTWTNLLDLTLPISPFTFFDSSSLTRERFYRAVTP
jgi:Immunoglobulin domain